jgi:cytochrome c oxidase cbb3-type subunit III
LSSDLQSFGIAGKLAQKESLTMKCKGAPTNRRKPTPGLLGACTSLGRISCWIALAAAAFGAQQKLPVAPSMAQAGDQGEAKSTYESVCAACHGLDARGSERGPNLATKPEVLQKSDKELIEILKDGRTAAGMPSFASYPPATLASLVAYLRLLQGQRGPEPLPGDPVLGKALFYAKAKCAECHMIGGQGGFWGQDLTTYAARMNADELRGRILHPGKDYDARRGLVQVTLANSRTFSGVVRNEDNFSLQLQTADGVFHLLSKSDVRSQTYMGHSPMPSDYSSILSAVELNDLVSYLLRTAGSGNEHKPNHGPEDGDEE